MDMSHIPRSVRLEHHLRHNHYPPVPYEMFPYVARALELGRCKQFLTIQRGDALETLFDDGFPVSAEQLIEQFHLDIFVDEKEADDGG